MPEYWLIVHSISVLGKQLLLTALQLHTLYLIVLVRGQSQVMMTEIALFHQVYQLCYTYTKLSYLLFDTNVIFV